MKRILLITLVLFSFALAEAQSFTALPNDTIESTNDVNDWMSDYIYIGNTSGSALNLSFQTIVNTMDPLGWNVLLCTSSGCYSYVPSSGLLGTVLSGDSAHFNLHCGFMGIAGDGEISVRVYETGNPTNADTITFIYHAVSTAGIFDHSENNVSALSQNFPNPFLTSTTINYNLEEEGGNIIITDVNGKNICNYILENKSGKLVVDLKLKPGIYFYSLYNKNNIISKNKMIVQ